MMSILGKPEAKCILDRRDSLLEWFSGLGILAASLWFSYSSSATSAPFVNLWIQPLLQDGQQNKGVPRNIYRPRGRLTQTGRYGVVQVGWELLEVQRYLSRGLEADRNKPIERKCVPETGAGVPRPCSQRVLGRSEEHPGSWYVEQVEPGEKAGRSLKDVWVTRGDFRAWVRTKALTLNSLRSS